MELINRFTSKRGKIELYFIKENSSFLAKPSGFIGKNVLFDYLNTIIELDKCHSEKFNYIVDTSRVIFANPLNPIYLRAINRLINIRF